MKPNNTNSLTVALDLDSTIYDLMGPWVAYIRDVLGEDVTGGLQRWDTHNQFPKSGLKVYDFLEIEGMFFNLRPLPGAIRAIKYVDEFMGVRQIFVTTCATKTGPSEKQKAIKRDFPNLAKNVLVTSGIKDCVKADVLVDDGPHNLDAFPGVTVKVPYAYNHDTRANYVMDHWVQYPQIIENILKSRSCQ